VGQLLQTFTIAGEVVDVELVQVIHAGVESRRCTAGKLIVVDVLCAQPQAGVVEGQAHVGGVAGFRAQCPYHCIDLTIVEPRGVRELVARVLRITETIHPDLDALGSK